MPRIDINATIPMTMPAMVLGCKLCGVDCPAFSFPPGLDYADKISIFFY
jgi:hypothetical protein